jgi:hypothetical protein
MSHAHRYRHVVRVLVAFACTLLGLAASAPAAFAMRIGVEDSGGSPPPLPTGKDPTYTLPHTVVTGGMPGWELALIATVAILLVAVIAVVVHRVRTAHRTRLVPAA